MIDRGVEPGETVVTEGQLRLTPGSHVQVQASHESARGRRSATRQNQLGSSRVNISEVFIRRPIATSLLMAGIALFGVVAYRGLAVSDLPSVDFPTIQVQVGLPGADPTTMASAVATPLERQFTSIAGLDSMTSTSSTGNTQITLQFDLDRDIDGAAVDVQTAISEATPLLPAGLPAPPSFRKSNPADQPIMYLALTSATLPLWTIDEYAETLVAQRLSMVSGVAQVQVWGSAKYAVRVQVDPDKLNAKQLGLNEIDTALNGWNVNTPVGTLYGAHTAYNIQANGQLMHAEDYRPLVVAWRNGAPIRLDEVANVIDSIENDKNASWANTSEGRRASGPTGRHAPGRQQHHQDLRRHQARAADAASPSAAVGDTEGTRRPVQ